MLSLSQSITRIWLHTFIFFELFGHLRDIPAKSLDIPPKKFDFPGFEGHTELFGPHPFTWKTRTQKFGFVLFFCACLDEHIIFKSVHLLLRGPIIRTRQSRGSLGLHSGSSVAGTFPNGTGRYTPARIGASQTCLGANVPSGPGTNGQCFGNPNPYNLSKKHGSTHPICTAVRPPHLYRRTFLASKLRRKGNPAIRLPFALQYASHLYRQYPPICTAVLLENTGGWGHRNVSEPSTVFRGNF